MPGEGFGRPRLAGHTFRPDNNRKHGGMEAFFGGEFPSEMTEALKQHADREQMIREARRREVKDFIDSLDPDQLATLRLVIESVCDENSGRLGAYYEGVISQTLVLKFGVCGQCGQNHDDSPEALLEAHTEPEEKADPDWDFEDADPIRKPGPLGTESLFSVPEELVIPPDVEHIGHTGKISAEVQAEMDRLNLDDLRDEDTGKILGFVCKACGHRYVSPHDRGLRELCHGCVQKTKWG